MSVKQKKRKIVKKDELSKRAVRQIEILRLIYDNDRFVQKKFIDELIEKYGSVYNTIKSDLEIWNYLFLQMSQFLSFPRKQESNLSR